MKYSKIVFLFIIFISTVVFSQSPTNLPATDLKALSLVENKEYSKAVEYLSSNMSNFKDKKMMQYLLARSYENNKEFDKAIQEFDVLIKIHPDSLYTSKSRYRKALIYTHQKKFSEAYNILKDGLEKILDPKRRQELAKIYIQLAEKISFQKDLAKNNYQLALKYYQKSLEIGLLPEDDLKTQYRIALCYYYLKDYSKSKELFTQLIKNNTPFLKKAHFYLAESEKYLGDLYKSRTHYFKVLNIKSNQTKEEDLSPQALYHLGQTYCHPYPRSEEQLELGVKYWSILINKYPQHKLAPQSAYYIGLSYLNFPKLHNQAIKALLSFIEKYPGDDNAPIALENVGSIYLYKNEFDTSIDYYNKFIKLYSNHKLWQKVHQNIINAKYRKGYYYFNQKKYKLAQEVLNEFLKEYPIHHYNPQMMYTLGEISFIEKKWDEAIDRWEKLHSKYPHHVISHKGLYSIAGIYIDKKNQFDKGIEYLKKVRYNPWYNLAQTYLKQLEEKSLSIQVKKLFLSADKPSIPIKTRNIMEFKVNIYQLDLQEYFIRNHSLKNIEKLDILLIKPDKTYSHTIKSYQKYKLFSEDLTLNIPNQGAYVVSISSDTLKSTTLLLKSDLGLIVQGNKSELLIHTKNIRNETPEGNVKIYVSNGKGLLLEGETDNSGIFKHRYTKQERLQDMNNLVVLVEKKGNYAGTELNTGSSSSFNDKKYIGYIYSDKPVYKPGDIFSYKGILRYQSNGILSQLHEKDYLVQFISPSGEKLYEKTLTQSPFGTLDGTFQLPRTLSDGWGKLKIQSLDQKSASFEKQFEIRNYTKIEKEILFKSDKSVYYPRDDIKLTIIGKHLFGLPAARKMVFYKIENENYNSKRLNSKGILEIKIPTVKYGNKNGIKVDAYLEGGDKVFSKWIPIVIKDFSINLNAKYSLYLQDEKAQINISTKDFFGKGVSKKLSAELFLLKDDKEIKIATKSIETDSKGQADIDFSFKEGGRYLVNVEGKGQNKITVRQAIQFYVIRKDDKQKLFIITENKSYKIGETTDITIYSIKQSGNALLTIIGENILDHRYIQIKNGKNTIPLSINEKLIPNFQLRVTLIKPDNVYSTEKELHVEAGVQIDIKTNKEVYQPGETLKIDLTTKDTNGKSISTESSVVLVDEGVLLLTGTRLKDIKRYFYQQKSFPNHTMNGSTPYNYISITEKQNQTIVKTLLEESNRAASEAKRPRQEALEYRRKYMKRYYRNGRGGDTADEDLSAASKGFSENGVVKQDTPRGTEPNVSKDKFGITQGGLTLKSQISKVRELFPDTAYFNPRVTTDSDGTKSLEIQLPNTHNRWHIIVISNTKGSQFGMSEKTISVRKDFVIHMETPVSLTEGDQFTIDGSLINATKDQKNGTLKLNVNNTDKSINYSIASNDNLSFQSNKSTAGSQDLSIQGSTPEDSEKRTIPVTPWGTKVYKGVTGSTESTKTEWIPLDNLSAKNIKFNLKLYSGFNQALFTINDILSLSNYLFINQVASHLISKISLFQYLNAYDKDKEGEILRIKQEIQDKITFLSSSKNRHGSWNWIYRRGEQNVLISAYTYYALSLAKSNGFKVSDKVLMNSQSYLLQSFSRLSNQDYETKIFILWALSQNKKANYSYVNRIYRNRGQLSLKGLNFLALTLHNMNRKGEAEHMLSLIENKVRSNNWNSSEKENKAYYLDFLSSKNEVIALSVLSLLTVQRYTLKAKPLMIKLLSTISNRHLITQELFAIFSQSIVKYLVHQKPLDTQYNLVVKWNDEVILNKTITGIQPTLHIPIIKNIIDKNKLEINVNGRGEVFYSGNLSYFKPGVILENIKKYGVLTKFMRYPNYKLGGTDFNSGYSTIQADSYQYKQNLIKDISRNTLFPVTLKLYLNSTRPERFFIIEDYIPAGCTLVQNSVTGNVQYYKQNKNKLTFYINRKYKNHRYVYVNYSLISRFEGNYRTLPPQAYPIHDREKVITGKITQLNINNENYNTFITYTFSPDELYHIGKYYFDNSDYEKSEQYLTKIFSEYTLRDQYYKEACRMFVYIYLKKKDHQNVVKYFEFLKERYPELTIPFKEVIQIAESYGIIGEYERAIQVLNGILRGYYLQEVALSGLLNELNQIEQSQKLSNRLYFEYPDDPVILKTYYTFGQSNYLRYTELIEKKVPLNNLNPETFYKISKEIFQNYLVFHPEDYISDEVSFTLLNLQLDHSDYESTIRNALVYTNRFPKSRFLDGYKYIAAHALFRKGDYRIAQKLSKSVAYDKFPGTEGQMRYSDNRNFAILMLAKIFHFNKDFKRALDEYEKISDNFVEAKRSIEFIKQRKIQLKEVTQIKQNEENTIELTYKGLNSVQLKLYKVNFTILCLKEKDLTTITSINLSGIKPFFEKHYNLSKEIPYVPQKKRIQLPIKDIGAYLLVFKSKDIQGSGIILKSNLSFDAIEKSESGRIRVTVLDEKNDFVKSVNIKFIGTGENDYRSSKTDLRGVSETENFPTLSLVVGEKNGHYCFYRSQRVKNRDEKKEEPTTGDSKASQEQDSLYNIRSRRSGIQQKNKAYYKNQMNENEDIQGVKIQNMK